MESSIKRDLFAELRAIGLTSDQCCEILDWTEKLPIHISGLNYTKVSVEQGLIKIEPRVEEFDQEIKKDIDDQSSEWAWIYNQKGYEREHKIAKESFLEGAEYVLEMLKEKNN